MLFRSPRDAHSQRPHPRNHAHALSHGNRASRIEDVEQMRTLQTDVVSRENREAGLLANQLRVPYLCLSVLWRDRVGILTLLQRRISLQQSLTLSLTKLEVLPRLR